MIERLDKILERYNFLENELTKQEVISDIKKTKEYSKELANLEDLIRCYKRYKDVLNGIEEAKELMSDSELGEMAKEEFNTLTKEKEDLEQELEVLLIPKDPNDDKNAIIEIRGAAGGDEANIFAGDLFRMYTRYA